MDWYYFASCYSPYQRSLYYSIQSHIAVNNLRVLAELVGFPLWLCYQLPLIYLEKTFLINRFVTLCLAVHVVFVRLFVACTLAAVFLHRDFFHLQSHLKMFLDSKLSSGFFVYDDQ